MSTDAYTVAAHLSDTEYNSKTWLASRSMERGILNRVGDSKMSVRVSADLKEYDHGKSRCKDRAGLFLAV